MTSPEKLARYGERRLCASGHGRKYFLEWIAKHPAPRGFVPRTTQPELPPLASLWPTKSAPEPDAEKPSVKPERAPAPPRPRDPRLPPVGTTICREWNGAIVSVRVEEKGFTHQGKHFGSLSRLAATLARMKAVNGFAWWGLIPGGKIKSTLVPPGGEIPTSLKRKRVVIK